MITSTNTPTNKHDGLITYIFDLLKDSNIQMFQQCIRKLHVNFQEGKLGNITVTSMLVDI